MEKWSVKTEVSYSNRERKEYSRKLESVQREREIEKQKRIAEAKEKSTQRWQHSSLCISYPYLTRKGIQGYGIRISEEKLIIPLMNAEGELQGLQFIDQDGNKKFLHGTQKTGNYFLIGQPKQTLCIAEGFTTGASIHEATGYAVAIAFDCGNLLSVAKVLRHQFPELKIIICADDDFETKGNPGITKGTETS